MHTHSLTELPGDDREVAVPGMNSPDTGKEVDPVTREVGTLAYHVRDFVPPVGPNFTLHPVNGTTYRWGRTVGASTGGFIGSQIFLADATMHVRITPTLDGIGLVQRVIDGETVLNMDRDEEAETFALNALREIGTRTPNVMGEEGAVNAVPDGGYLNQPKEKARSLLNRLLGRND